jgi:phosphoribosylanthranilate isomerase
MLKRKVLVNGISNLSDARYCAGMFVDYISFELNSSHPDFIPVDKIVEIKNWLSGLKIGGRITNWPEYINEENWKELQFDFLIINNAELKDKALEKVSELFYQGSESLTIDLKPFDHVLVDDQFINLDLIVHNSIFVGPNVTIETLESVVNRKNVVGIALKGNHEIRPGESSYDDLMDVLEALEMEE